MREDCIIHPGELEGLCPFCDPDLIDESYYRELDLADTEKWATLLGFFMDMKEKGVNHFKVNVSNYSLIIEHGEDSIEIEIN